MSRTTNAPSLIVLSGLPATGKSQLAQRIARALGITALSVDAIEGAMHESGVEASVETGLASYLVARAIADAQLALGQAVLVDADNVLESSKAIWRALAMRREVRLRVIECYSSDSSLHRKHFEARKRGGLARGESWDDVERMMRDYAPWTEPTLRVDAKDPPDANAARAIVWLLEPAETIDLGP